MRAGDAAAAAVPLAAQPTGSVALSFAAGPDGVTYVKRQLARYPFHICRPHRYQGDPPGMITLYLQSCAGGIFEHDRLRQDMAAQPGARVHVTTQASTIVHRMSVGDARQETVLTAEAGALLEFLPDPMILFPGARLASRVLLRADPTATIMLGDAFLMHDPDGQERRFDRLSSEVTVESPGGEVLALDRFSVSGAAMAAGTPGICGSYRALGSLTIVHRAVAGETLVAAARTALEPVAGIYAGASLLPGGVGAIVRVLAEDSLALRAGIAAAWAAFRGEITGAVPPVRRK